MNETGHIKNIANFENLIIALRSMEDKYNPSATDITIVELQALLVKAKNALEKVRKHEAPYKIAVNNRQQAFDGLNKLVTRVVNAFTASNATEKEIKDFKSLARKITSGKTKTTKKADEQSTDTATNTDEDTKTKSTSQLSYDNKIANLKSILNYISQVESYKPNEEELKYEKLNDYVNTLPLLNILVNENKSFLTNARIERDQILYTPETGIVARTQKIKAYIKSIYGATAPQYKMISKISVKGAPSK